MPCAFYISTFTFAFFLSYERSKSIVTSFPLVNANSKEINNFTFPLSPRPPDSSNKSGIQSFVEAGQWSIGWMAGAEVVASGASSLLTTRSDSERLGAAAQDLAATDHSVTPVPSPVTRQVTSCHVQSRPLERDPESVDQNTICSTAIHLNETMQPILIHGSGVGLQAAALVSISRGKKLWCCLFPLLFVNSLSPAQSLYERGVLQLVCRLITLMWCAKVEKLSMSNVYIESLNVPCNLSCVRKANKKCLEVTPF